MRVWDISVPVSPGLPVWPGDSRVVLEQIRSISKGDSSTDSRLACSVHAGTHVDAPAHFIENRETVEQLPLDVLIGEAIVVEIPDDDIITPEIMEAQNLPAETKRLLFKTKNSELWNDSTHSFKTDFVALSFESAAWIVRRGMRLVGIDYLSIQLFSDKEPLTHRTLLDAGVVIVEGLDLREVNPGSYQLVCLPLKLAGSEGAPARAVLIET
jgi:arylformamidase